MMQKNACHVTCSSFNFKKRQKQRKEFIGKHHRPTRIQFLSKGNGSGARQHLHA